MRPPVKRTVKQDRELVPVLLDAYNGDENKVAAYLGRCKRFVRTWAARNSAGLGVGNAP